jgi:hypothetical protein
MASLVLGAVGFVVGGAIGGPWGARIGYAVGTAVGSRIDQPKTNVSGPRLNDLRVQSSTWGERIPIVYGSYRTSGNVIWSAGIREVVSRTRNRGKGGGGQTTTTYTYFSNFAVAICEGPIIGVKRIWANGKLYYNAGDNGNPATLIESQQRSGLFTIYLGTEAQTPSSVIEADKGAGNVPAYRGLAYIVFENLPLADYGNALPNLEFEVVTAGVISQSVWASYALAFPPGGRTARLASDGSRLVMYGTESPVSSQNVSYYSDDRGLTWTQGSMQVTPGLGVVQAAQELAYGDGVWLIGQSNGAGHYHRSTDGGASWTRLAYTSTFAGGSVAFGNGIWVSIWGNFALRSTNGGVTWTQHSRPSTGNPTHTIWAGDRFVTLNSGTTVQWSIDGTSWTNTTTNSGDKRAASNGAGVIVAVYPAVSSQFYTLSTDNGQTWSMVQFPGAAQTYVDVAWGGDRFVVIAGGAGNTTSYYSLNGIDGWTAVTQAITRSSARLAYAFPYFVSLHSVSASQDAQRYANYSVLTANTIPVASIVADQFARSGLTSGQYNTAGLIDSVTGYLVPRVSSARDNIAPLQQAFFFDVVESGAELKLVKRGGSIVATIPDDDLGAHPFGADSPASVSIQRTQEVDLPSRVSVRYANAVGDYLPAVEASRRIVADSRQEEVLELPIALTPNQAAQIAEVTMYNQYIARTRYTFSTAIKYAKYEPTDVLSLPLEFGTARARVIRKEESGPQINWEAVGDDALIYQSTAAGGTQQASQTQIILPSLTRTDWLDIPIVRDQDNDASAYIVLSPESSAVPWRGAELFVSPDDAEFEQVGQAFQVAARGQCSTTLGNFTGGNINDEGNTLTVVLTSGTLDTVTATQWLNGALTCLIGNEIVFARVATLTAANTYTLSGLLRGRFGTEQHIGTHGAGERFVRLATAGTLRPPLSESEIGISYFYRAISVGRRFDSDASEAYTSTAVGLRPLSGVNVRGGRQHNDHYHVSWDRRTRVDGGWRSGVDVPLAEEIEAYEVDILNGVNVVRTFRVSTPFIDYTGSQQTADFGSHQASISIVIYQMSSAVGRGFPRAATVT